MKSIALVFVEQQILALLFDLLLNLPRNKSAHVRLRDKYFFAFGPSVVANIYVE